MSPNAVYTTLLTNTAYLPGALVLERSLRSVGSQYPLVVMVSPGVSQAAKDVLRNRELRIVEVDNLDPPEGVHSLGGNDPRFLETWTKLRAFGLVDYERVILLDSDMMIMKNMDELMDMDLPKDWIAATPVCACNARRFAHYPADWIPENCIFTHAVHPTAITTPPTITESSPRPYSLLNSGTVVLNPSATLFEDIAHYLATSPLVPTFSFPDQDLLSAFFKGKWRMLPWCYNALKTLRVLHRPVWRDDEIRCLHYCLAEKPWHGKGTGGDYEEINGWWWDMFDKLGEEMQNTDPAGWALVSSNVVL